MATTEGSQEIVLFGVRIAVDSMRKTVSVNNLVDYQHVDESGKGVENENAGDVVAAGYVSADNVGRNPLVKTRERKRGTPWSPEEHKRFLEGLQRVGKGDWRGISKNFVKTRTPTQVASHAQKYFIRHTTSKRRRRTSLFDITPETITPETVAETPAQEHPQSNQGDSASSQPHSPTTNSSQTSFYPMVPFIPVQMQPPPVAPMSFAYPVQGQFPGQVTSVPAFNFNYMAYPSPQSLDLSLSLSNQNQTSPNPALQTMPRWINNGNSFIPVV